MQNQKKDCHAGESQHPENNKLMDSGFSPRLRESEAGRRNDKRKENTHK